MQVFGQVFSVLGQDPEQNQERIKGNIQKFRQRYNGYTDEELVDLAKQEVPQMVSAALRQQEGKNGIRGPALQEAQELEAVRKATAQDRMGREFLSVGASALSSDPVAARKQFVDNANEPYNAAYENWTNRNLAREKDMQQAKDLQDLRKKTFETNQAAQAVVMQQQDFDAESPVSRAYRANAAGVLKQVGRADLLPRLEGMSKAEIDRQMPMIAEYLKNQKAIADIDQTRAATGLTGAQTRGARAEAGLKELTTTAAQNAYENNGSVPAAVQDQVYDAPTVSRIKAANERLSKLTEESAERQKTLGSISRINKLVDSYSVNTGPVLGKISQVISPIQMQKLVKELADLEAKMGKNVGATDAARALAGQAAPDINKFNEVIKSITNKLRAEVLKDEVINQRLAEASRTGKIKDYNEALDRAGMVTVNLFQRKDGRPLNTAKVFTAEQVKAGELREYVKQAEGSGFKVQITKD